MSLILLVDDDKDMTVLTSRWLTKAGYEVETVYSGPEALSFMEGSQPDLVLLDYAMPEMDGPAVFEAMKANEKTKEIPVLFRTGMDDENSADILDRISPRGVIPKSEGKAALLSAVSEVLPL